MFSLSQSVRTIVANNWAPVLVLASLLAASATARSDELFTNGFEDRELIFPRVTAAGQEPVENGLDADAAAIYGDYVSVVLSSGEARLDRSDLTVPGRGQISFGFSRRYRSQINYDGPLGYGWDFAYNERLSILAGGSVARSNGYGHVATWVKNPDTSYTAPPGQFGTLTVEGNGSYLLREPSGFKRAYSSTGMLQQHTDRHGNSMQFIYDGDGNLVQIIDVFGRTYSLTYDYISGRNRITSLIDFSGREVVYSYDNSGDLISVRSPVVTGTSIGNDFPSGRTEQYSYHNDPAPRGHNLATVTLPEEVALSGPAAVALSYGSTGLGLDRVTVLNAGGTNASGFAAGGPATLAYLALNTGIPLGDPSIHRLQVSLVDRNGTMKVFLINELNHLKTLQEKTLGLRPGEPGDHFETTFDYDADSQLTQTTFPEGNRIARTYDNTGSRAQKNNLLEVRRIADAPRGGGEDLVTTMGYEPVFNQLRSVTGPRGNAIAYVPPIGVTSADRYTTEHFYDYQENTATIPDVTKYAISLTGIPRGLGDINQDGVTSQISGNRIRTERPDVTLRPGSHQAAATGSTTQQVVTEVQWNDRGQQLANIDAEGNASRYTYFPENDPDGDGTTVPGQGSTLLRGYLNTSTQDSSSTSNRRTATAPPAALLTLVGYDPSGNMTTRQDPRGVVNAYEYNQLNELVVETRGANIDTAISTGELITGESAFSYRTRHYFDDNGRVILKEVENRAGVSVTPGVGDWVDHTYSYDILNNLLDSTVEIDGSTAALTRRNYDANDLMILVTKPEGNQVAVDYDERNLKFRIHDGFGSPDQATRQLDYDLNGNLKQRVDAEDNDAVPGPETTTYLYDGFDRKTTIVDSLGNQTSSVYDPASNVTQHQVNGHRANQPAAGNVVLADELFFQDELNRVYQIDQLLFLADGFNPLRPEDLRDDNSDGRVTDFVEYDALSRITYTTEDDGDTVTTEYDGVDRSVLTADPLGNQVELTYDANDNVIQRVETDVSDTTPVPDETFTSYYVYDQLDRWVRETDNVGHTRRYQYDSRGNLSKKTDAESPTLITDPLLLFPGDINQPGNSSRYLYDGRDLRTDEMQDLRVGGTGDGAIDTSNASNNDGVVTLSYSHDLNSRLTGMTDDNGNTTVYQYDTLDRKTRHINADTTELVQSYDRDNNLVTVVDPNGSVITNTYDGLGRLVQRDATPAAGVVGTTQETYAYDGLSRLTQSVDNNGVSADHQVDRFYDSLGRLIEEQQDLEPYSNIFAGDGRRLTLSYPTNRNLDFQYDALNRVTQVIEPFPNPIAAKPDATKGPPPALTVSDTDWIGPGQCSADCPCDSRPLLIAMGNGTELSFLDPTGSVDQGYSTIGEPIEMEHLLGGSQFVDRNYDYNRESMRVGELMSDLAGAPHDLYSLDSAYRSESTLIDDFGGETFTQLMEYTLDGVGNRVAVDFTQDFGGSPIIFGDSYVANIMNEYDDAGSAGGGGRQHDDNGNLIDANGFLYLYDYRNRLVEVRRKSDSALRATYEYDTDNRRVRRTTFILPTATIDEERRYLYDNWNVIEEWADTSDYNTNGPVATYVYGAGLDQPTQLEASVSAVLPGKFWFHRDVRNNVVAMTDVTGAMVERTRFDDFGNFGQSASIDNRYLFQGRRYDPETGFFYFRNRYYDPLTGRFIQRDPIWDPNNRGNQFTFVGNGPMSAIDPLGLNVGGFGLDVIGWWGPVGLDFSLDVVVDSTGDIGLVPAISYLAGAGAGGGVTVGPTYSNVPTISDLEGESVGAFAASSLGSIPIMVSLEAEAVLTDPPNPTGDLIKDFVHREVSGGTGGVKLGLGEGVGGGVKITKTWTCKLPKAARPVLEAVSPIFGAFSLAQRLGLF